MALPAKNPGEADNDLSLEGSLEEEQGSGNLTQGASRNSRYFRASKIRSKEVV